MEMRSGDSIKNRDESSELSLCDNQPVTVADGAVSIHFHTLCCSHSSDREPTWSSLDLSIKYRG